MSICDHNKKTTKLIRRYLEVDECDTDIIDAGGIRRIKSSKIWTTNTFDEWRVAKGYSIKISANGFFEEENVEPLVDMLKSFIFRVTTTDGSMYKPTMYESTIINLFVFSFVFLVHVLR